MPVFKTPCESAYSKLDKEDLDEVRHKRAQFLIYKAMEQADLVTRSRPPCLFLKMRISRELRIGKRLKKLKKGVSSLVSGVRFRSHRKDTVTKTKAAWICFFCRQDEKTSVIPPLLI